MGAQCIMGFPEQRKFDASQGNSAAQLATTMVLG